MFKKIDPTNNTELLNATEGTLAMFSAITGKQISRGEAPLVGKYMTIDGKRICENEPIHKDLQFAYEWSEDGELILLYVGSEIHGPLLSWCSVGWRNLYGRGNHGNNGACGGTWSANSFGHYETISEAVDNRDYKVGGIVMYRSRMIEGPALIEALRSIN